ncbi:hypothetical protein [Nocardioides sp. SYSU D00038]|uniref:hypothetical protein n=1 Tax=Nocardioides sp. SYSU D00038 TaxID=2812554 RepID=UPI00196715DA|nr:hypothetical protein [Nocardioides sp. SYSU D00038]
MARRVNLPAADDLFRPTDDDAPSRPKGQTAQGKGKGAVRAVPDQPEPGATRRPSGRVRHDEKMTVYVTSEELLDIEHARLTLRRHGIAVDRGRLVREALALVLAELEAEGESSALVKRLAEE